MSKLTKKQVENNLKAIDSISVNRAEITAALWHTELPRGTDIHAAVSVLANAWADPVHGPTIRHAIRAHLEARE